MREIMRQLGVMAPAVFGSAMLGLATLSQTAATPIAQAVAAITSITPGIVSAGNEITVLIKAPSVTGRQVTLEVFALDSDAEKKALAPPSTAAAPPHGAVSTAWYTTNLSDNGAGDLDSRAGIIMLKIKTNTSWGPPPGVRSIRRYGLMVSERPDPNVPAPAIVALNALRQVRVVIGSEFSALEIIRDEINRLLASAKVLENVSGDQAKWQNWETTMKKLDRACTAHDCVAGYDGLLLGSSAWSHAKKQQPNDPALKAFGFVADSVTSDYTDVLGAVQQLPAEEQLKFYEQLLELETTFKSIRSWQDAHASSPGKEATQVPLKDPVKESPKAATRPPG